MLARKWTSFRYLSVLGAVSLFVLLTALPARADGLLAAAVGATPVQAHLTRPALSSLTALRSAPVVAMLKPARLDQPRGALDLRAPVPATEGADHEFRESFPIHWQQNSGLIDPRLEHLARNFRRQGLPLVHLWQSASGEHLLAIGLNGHGVPGIWLTQKVGN
jgi:hypothetical protein